MLLCLSFTIFLFVVRDTDFKKIKQQKNNHLCGKKNRSETVNDIRKKEKKKGQKDVLRFWYVTSHLDEGN